ncbi:hypothetical protein NL676_024079 [Syzygium grande]|nr:hypothetical protein NL676_024079 [Syzygium grande]
MEKVLLRLRLSQMLDRRVPRRVPPSLRRPPPPLRRLIGGCRQVMVSRFGGPVGLELRNVEFPPIFNRRYGSAFEVSINTIDLATSYGLPSRTYLPSPPFVLGYDFSGEDIQLAVKGKFDVVFDTIGASRTKRIGLGLLKRGGRYVNVEENLPLDQPDSLIYPFRDNLELIADLYKNHGIVYRTISGPSFRPSLEVISKLVGA